MKKLLIILSMIVIVFSLTSCSKKKEQNYTKPEEEKKEEVPKKEEYKDTNPIKLALYEYNNGVFTKKNEYFSPMNHFKDIALFSVILTNEDKVNGYGTKQVWNQYYGKYENISDYKVGYHVSFTLKNGKKFDETILKPLEFSHFSFYVYLYIWLYDDINQTASWYSHLEENEYTDKTIMSSIKLMSTTGSDEIVTPIDLTVFTYKDENDFDANGKYRGNSKFTMQIKRSV